MHCHEYPNTATQLCTMRLELHKKGKNGLICVHTNRRLINEQGWAQAQANNSKCGCMPATTSVLTAPSAALDTPTCHAYLHLISPSNNFNINNYIQKWHLEWIKIKRWQKKMSMVLDTSTYRYLAWVLSILEAQLGSVQLSATEWLRSTSWCTHRFSHGYTCSDPWVTWTHAQL